MKASGITPRLIRVLQNLDILRGVPVGDAVKSWDVLLTAQFIREHLRGNDPILDIGAYASEILPALHRLGYSSLTGVDLNPGVRKMPYPRAIRYEVADFLRSPFGDGSFDAITSISVIEHGFNAPRLLGEVTRLLRPGGYFLASFDYWPAKVDTTGSDPFGMSWTIFSKGEVLRFLSDAAGAGMVPVGPVDLEAEEPAIRWGGKDYTFAWMALRKNG
jgi:SAM-dependent methyltransferase